MLSRVRGFLKEVRGKMGKKTAARREHQNKPLSPVYEEAEPTGRLQVEAWEEPLEEEDCEVEGYGCEECWEGEGCRAEGGVKSCKGCADSCEECCETKWCEAGFICEDCLEAEDEVSEVSNPGFDNMFEDNLEGSEMEYVRPGTPWAGFRHVVQDTRDLVGRERKPSLARGWPRAAR